MVIGIGHYERNITPTASKNGVIKSLGTVEEPGTAASAMKSKEVEKKNTASHAPINNSVRYELTIVTTKISHYGQNITPTEAINGGIKSLNTINEQGTGVSAVKSIKICQKSRQATELWWKQA